MLIFESHGPFNVPTYNGKAAKIVDSERLSEFWLTTNGLEKRRGCYVFAVRAAKGYRPLYVGKATKTLKQEVFATHKLEKYQRALADIGKGTPVLFSSSCQRQKASRTLAPWVTLRTILSRPLYPRTPTCSMSKVLNLRNGA